MTALGVEAERVYVDHGLTGTNRARPGLREALAATRGSDTLVVTKLDRLARSLADARHRRRADRHRRRAEPRRVGARPHRPGRRLLFTILGMVTELESDLITMRTKEGLAIAPANGTLRGRSPKLSAGQEAHLAALHATGTRTPADLAHHFGIARSTVYRAIARSGQAADPADTTVTTTP